MTNYDKKWKAIDSLINKKGLTQSALQEVNTLYTLAKKEQQQAQLIKALVYKASLQQSTDEAADAKAFTQWQAEIAGAEAPASALLQSILAEKYYGYFQQHRWQLYDRTATTVAKTEDPATWAAADFHKKITELYLASLTNEKKLQQATPDAYDPIIVKGNTRNLRPTLYDLLAHRALDYFKNGERDIARPAYAFEIKDPAYFSSAADFAKLSITTPDSSSLYHKALLVYQQLLLLHLHDQKPDALIDADIARLQFVQQYGVMEEKEQLYEKALTYLTDKYNNQPAAAQASYLLATLYAGRAAQYEPLKTDDDTNNKAREAYIIANKICRQVLAQTTASEGQANCYNLLQQIERKELKLATEKVNIPGQPFRTLVSYRNIGKIYYRVAMLSNDVRNRVAKRYEENYWKDLAALTPLRSSNQALPSTEDYHQHHAEIKIDALPVGEYVLLASGNADFSFDKNPMAVQFFYVSGISYITLNNYEYFVLNRETGQPMAGASVQTWLTNYDYNTRNNKKNKGELQTTNKNGYVKLSKKINGREGNLQLEITAAQDKLFLDDQNYVYYRDETNTPAAANASQYEKDHGHVFFFADRSIYRPGQTVYFKGIAITKDFTTRKNKVYSGIKTTISLLNANGEVVDSVELTTNDYGSYSGKFTLPQGVLNGQFTLEDGDIGGSLGFSVEEYKRPKFFVEYEPLTGSYRVNDSITITGFAKAYAGNNIDGAQVKYRVQRVARFIYPWLYWRGGYPRGSNMEISNGTITTRADGKFAISFKAIPDLTVNKALEPIFDYIVSADITDLNGETRSGRTTVPVAYKALQLSIGLPDNEAIAADSLKRIPIATRNIAGTSAPALVTLTLSRLQAPDRLIRRRFWQQPDQFTMTREEFIKNFPTDEYNNEADYHSWAKEPPVITLKDSSNDNTKFNIQHTALPEGWYAAEAVTTDKFGATVKDIKYIQLYDVKSKSLPAAAYTWSASEHTLIEPGETAAIAIGSTAKDVFLIQEIDKRRVNETDADDNGENPDATYNFITLNGKQSFNFKATEADRGGFGVYHFFVKNNRFYSFSNSVNIPWNNKALQISYETFRDKTLPGSDEKWKLKITGYKKERLAAEMLASMYDASLDQFVPHNWSIPGIWDTYSGYNNWQGNACFTQVQSQERYWNADYRNYPKIYDALLTMGNSYGGRRQLMEMRSAAPGAAPMVSMDKAQLAGAKKMDQINGDGTLDSLSFNFTTQKEMLVHGEKMKKVADDMVSNTPVQIRKNFNETAFFIPDLKTDSAGNIEFGFTIPEALTQWKFQSLAHTKDLAFGFSSNTVITQKPLMVQPNAPRFLREGDKMEFSAKVVNLTEKELTGTVQLELINTATNQPVDGWFRNMYPVQYFTAAANQSTAVKFSIDVPYQYNSAVSYRFVAKAVLPSATPGKTDGAEVSDGEEASMPVLTNSMLVTESMPLPMRGDAAKNFRFEKLLQSGNSETLQQHALTVEFTTNPAWYAVQALPYLMEFPYECAEQTFNRYYANAIATKIANSSPRLKTIFEKWSKPLAATGRGAGGEGDTAALLSNLQKNPELKAVLLEETPWVMEAKNETQQKKNIALLFDMLRMSRELAASFEKLKQLQSSNGGFVWFKGGPDDRYMTQYIVTGLGHLAKLNTLNDAQQKDWAGITKAAVSYLDQRIKEDYDWLVKHKSDLSKNNLGYTQIQYLYMRSFFNNYAIPGASFTAISYYRKQSQQFWLQQNKYMQGMIALSLSRSGDNRTAADILKSLKQNAIVNEEMGMYWKENNAGYYWHQAPIETQSLLIEAFAEIGKDSKAVNDLKTWLLKQKQTQNWSTTKATAEACYALLLQGSDWLSNTPDVTITLGDKTISSAVATGKGKENAEAGTGYFKQTIDGPFVKPAMGEITVKIASPQNKVGAQPAWGAVYWQYFEQLDKITTAATPLQLKKQLFVEKNTDKGPVLEPIAENAYIKVGDKIKVRIELRVDRDMEYVHMKDMRASTMEPVNVLSGYKWQGGLGYYESTRDASTNFFFNWLPKGTYVFEYPLFVSHAGNFSNGVTSIQCMYAPEFSSHSEGIRVNVEENKP